MKTYRALDPAKVIDTIAALHERIRERFPGAGLVGVCAELLQIAKENSARVAQVSQRNVGLRFGIIVLLAAGAAGLVGVALLLFRSVSATADNVYSVLQGLEAAANLTVLLGAGVFFLTRIEERLKRRGALRALHELRSIIHVIDMHQLTKDPSARGKRRQRHGLLAGARALPLRGDALSRLLLGDAVADVQGRRAVRPRLPRPRDYRGRQRYRAHCRWPVAEDLAEDHDPGGRRAGERSH